MSAPGWFRANDKAVLAAVGEHGSIVAGPVHPLRRFFLWLADMSPKTKPHCGRCGGPTAMFHENYHGESIRMCAARPRDCNAEAERLSTLESSGR